MRDISGNFLKSSASLLAAASKSFSKLTGQMGKHKVSLPGKTDFRVDLNKLKQSSPFKSASSRYSVAAGAARVAKSFVQEVPKKQTQEKTQAWAATQPRALVKLNNQTAKDYHAVLRQTLVNHLGCSEDEARALCNQAALIHQHSQDFEKLKQTVDATLAQENPIWANYRTPDSEARRAEILGSQQKTINNLKAEFFSALQKKADSAYLNATDDASGLVERLYNNAQSGDVFDLSATHTDLLKTYLDKAEGMFFLGHQLRQAAQDELNKRASSNSK